MESLPPQPVMAAVAALTPIPYSTVRRVTCTIAPKSYSIILFCHLTADEPLINQEEGPPARTS